MVDNPVYNWDTVRATGYRWSIDRERAQLARVDAIRLNHFRAFAATWYAPAGAPTAQSAPFAFFTPHYDIAREYFSILLMRSNDTSPVQRPKTGSP